MDGQLTPFNVAKKALAEAVSIDEVKEIRDKAEAVRAYHKQAGDSLVMQNQCAEIKIRAERRAGEILAEMPKQNGARGKGINEYNKDCKVDVLDSHDESPPPVLKELGITWNQPSRWQKIAEIPEDKFESKLEEIKGEQRELTSAEILSHAQFLKREEKRAARREEAFKEAANIKPDERIQIRHGDYRKMLADVPDSSVQLILTDPIYLRDHLEDWSELSAFAARVLKPGKLLAAYCSNNILAEAIQRLSEHLEYVWTFAITYSEHGKTHHRNRLNGWWKPILMFSNGPYQPEIDWVTSDVIKGDFNRDHHKWQQGLQEAEVLINHFTCENDLVVDPFTGSGTVPLACKRLNRRCIASDLDPEAVTLARGRLAQESIR